MAKKKGAGAKSFGKQLTDDPDDAPELLSDFFRHGELRHGDRLVRRSRPPLSDKLSPRSARRVSATARTKASQTKT